MLAIKYMQVEIRMTTRLPNKSFNGTDIEQNTAPLRKMIVIISCCHSYGILSVSFMWNIVPMIDVVWYPNKTPLKDEIRTVTIWHAVIFWILSFPSVFELLAWNLFMSFHLAKYFSSSCSISFMCFCSVGQNENTVWIRKLWIQMNDYM